MSRAGHSAAQFLAWAAVGIGTALGVVGILTIGIFVLPVTGVLAVLLAWRGSRQLAGPGMLTGLALIPLWVGYLNRAGPGMICTTTATGGSCTQEMSPWPWVTIAIALAGAGAGLAIAAMRRSISERANPA